MRSQFFMKSQVWRHMEALRGHDFFFFLVIFFLCFFFFFFLLDISRKQSLVSQDNVKAGDRVCGVSSAVNYQSVICAVLYCTYSLSSYMVNNWGNSFLWVPNGTLCFVCRLTTRVNGVNCEVIVICFLDKTKQNKTKQSKKQALVFFFAILRKKVVITRKQWKKNSHSWRTFKS